jgi:ferrochelatase
MTSKESASGRGVLLVNLGSPASTSVPDVRAYLREFLSDPLVLDAPAPIRAMVLRLFILPFRPKRSAAAYSTIWTEEGSPLIVTGRRVAEEMDRRLEEPVILAMRYGEPSIRRGLEEARERGVTDLHVIPLYPHFAMSSTETVIRKVQTESEAMGRPFRLTFRSEFHSDPRYIDALRQVAAPYLATEPDHLLFSYHGVPVRHIEKRDPTGCFCLRSPDCCLTDHPATGLCYRAHCMRTTEALAAALGLPRDRYSVSFQSRLGRDPWLSPATDEVLQELPSRGRKRVLVICPSFVADCLETLEEIAVEGRETFIEAGGTDFTMVPCLNEHPAWLDCLEEFAREREPQPIERG